MRYPLLVATLAGVVACSDLEPVAPHEMITDGERMFMRLTLDHAAVNMAVTPPYDTLRLTATPLNALGQPMPGLPAPTFRSTDTSRVNVSPDGLLQARRAGGANVIAELVADGNIRRADTVRVAVTSTPKPRLVTFSIDPHPDSAVWSMVPAQSIFGQIFLLPAGIDIRPVLRLRALDSASKPITGLIVEYEALNPDVVPLNSRTAAQFRNPCCHRPGEAGFVVRTTAYGISKVDTAVFTITLPQVHGVIADEGPSGSPVFGASSVKIRPNGFVFWVNQTTQPMDITFEDPTNVAEAAIVCEVHGGDMCGAGNIPAIPPPVGGNFLGSIRGRQFPVPGVYTFRSPLLGLTGQVVVAP